MIKYTLVYPYYRQPETFRRHVQNWASWPEFILRSFQFVVVDDCSPEPLPLEGLPLPPNFSAFRVKDDIRWNYGAKNLGISMALAPWVILSEFDHLLPRNMAMQLWHVKPWPEFYYQFLRYNNDKTADSRYSDRPHRASLLMPTAAFWQAGGIEEDFCGHYGHDDSYLHDCLQAIGLKPKTLAARFGKLWNLSKHANFPDAELHGRIPQDWYDLSVNQKIYEAKRDTGQPSRRWLRFAWERTYPAYA